MYWKNGVATYLTTFAQSTASASSIFVSGSDVYVAGFEMLNGVKYAVYRNNGTAVKLEANYTAKFDLCGIGGWLNDLIFPGW